MCACRRAITAIQRTVHSPVFHLLSSCLKVTQLIVNAGKHRPPVTCAPKRDTREDPGIHPPGPHPASPRQSSLTSYHEVLLLGRREHKHLPTEQSAVSLLLCQEAVGSLVRESMGPRTAPGTLSEVLPAHGGLSAPMSTGKS